MAIALYISMNANLNKIKENKMNDSKENIKDTLDDYFDLLNKFSDKKPKKEDLTVDGIVKAYKEKEKEK